MHLLPYVIMYVYISERDLWPAPVFSLISLCLGVELPVYSFAGDDWTGAIPALEYGGFLPVGAAKMLPGYSGPDYGLALRHDLAFIYGDHLAFICLHCALQAWHCLRQEPEGLCAFSLMCVTLK